MREDRLRPLMIRDLGSGMKSTLNVPGTRLPSSTKNFRCFYPIKATEKGACLIMMYICTLSTAVLLYTCWDSEREEDNTKVQCDLGMQTASGFDGLRFARTNPFQRAGHLSLGHFGGRSSLSAFIRKTLQRAWLFLFVSLRRNSQVAEREASHRMWYRKFRPDGDRCPHGIVRMRKKWRTPCWSCCNPSQKDKTLMLIHISGSKLPARCRGTLKRCNISLSGLGKRKTRKRKASSAPTKKEVTTCSLIIGRIPIAMHAKGQRPPGRGVRLNPRRAQMEVRSPLNWDVCLITAVHKFLNAGNSDMDTGMH